MRLAFLIPPIMLLAACGQDKKATDETEVSINADGDGGNVQITSGKDGGKLKVNGDGVNIDLNIPDLGDMELGSDFDIDGVKLYPGSKIASIDVNASDKGGADKARVRLGFTSPAAPAKAADWMAGEFAKKNIQVQRAGDTLRGTDKDGADFTISFEPAGETSKGEVRIVKN